MPSLRLVFVLILQENLHFYIMDVKIAFLNGDLDEVVYMSPSQGYDDGAGKVCKLNKSLHAEIKKYMEKRQEEMKDRMEKGQEEMKKGQEEMKKGQEEMKNQIQSHVKSRRN
ncbi:hypothetical protein AVEN_167391-1 [Araneus ventricosus]|uniref:Reverse transcriptase Ty1/copia-type domain-containing protein n=1 Tax=Araneus ventricosus TaxID=182803 RepID=A0A4Y2VF61_ARAVE|nr:hypothetical protein AVEN_167391-1 [Araneus ventricosus]